MLHFDKNVPFRYISVSSGAFRRPYPIDMKQHAIWPPICMHVLREFPLSSW